MNDKKSACLVHIETIANHEPEFLVAVEEMLAHFASTYTDKYEDENDRPIVSKNILYDTELGKGANMHNTTKYLQRYITSGYKKSDNPTDLKKACHYIAFELVRLKKVEINDFVESTTPIPAIDEMDKEIAKIKPYKQEVEA